MKWFTWTPLTVAIMEGGDRDTASVAIVNGQSDSVASVTIFTTSPEVGEGGGHGPGSGGSKSAILNFSSWCVSSEALEILQAGFCSDRVGGVQIDWAPARSALQRNENAHVRRSSRSNQLSRRRRFYRRRALVLPFGAAGQDGVFLSGHS